MTTMLRTDSTTSGLDDLRALMYDALSVAEDDFPDAFDGGTTNGRTLLALAALARQAAGALGAHPGITVLAGPGPVVVRELAAAIRLLDRAATSPSGAEELDGILPTAKALHARLRSRSPRRGAARDLARRTVAVDPEACAAEPGRSPDRVPRRRRHTHRCPHR